MDNALIVCVLESKKYLTYKMYSFLPVDNLLLLDILFKSYSLNILHYDILKSVAEDYVVYLYKIGV